jgi:hypothetical protein
MKNRQKLWNIFEKYKNGIEIHCFLNRILLFLSIKISQKKQDLSC